MKRNILLSVILSGIALATVSCTKEPSSPDLPMVERTIQFVLYTNQDFSDDEHNITFSVFARDDNRMLLDSAITTMKVKEIPGANNKITIESKVITEATADLVVGFVYEIEHVGVSWFLDSIPPGQNHKIVEFAFK